MFMLGVSHVAIRVNSTETYAISFVNKLDVNEDFRLHLTIQNSFNTNIYCNNLIYNFTLSYK